VKEPGAHGTIVTVEVVRPGKGSWTFEETLVVDTEAYKVLYLERYGHRTEAADAVIPLEADSPLIWFVFPESWYEIGSFYAPSGKLLGWYTNFCTPFELQGRRWRTIDLFLDYWQPIAGEPRFLDEAELEDAVATGLVSVEWAAMLRSARESVEAAALRNAWPPPIVRRLDLDRVHSLLREG